MAKNTSKGKKDPDSEQHSVDSGQLRTDLLKLVQSYTDLAPSEPSIQTDFVAQKQKLVIGVVAVREFEEISFLYDSTCETRSVDHFFRQFRQFRGNRIRDYALVAPTESSVAVIDLLTEYVIANCEIPGYKNWEFYVPRIKHLLTDDNVGLHHQRADDVRIVLAHPSGVSDPGFAAWAKAEIAAWEIIVAQASALLGNDAFVSVVRMNSDPLENVLIRLNLSKVSEGILEISEPDEKIVVVPWAPLARSLDYSRHAAGELTVLQEVTHKLKKIW